MTQLPMLARLHDLEWLFPVGQTLHYPAPHTEIGLPQCGRLPKASWNKGGICLNLMPIRGRPTRIPSSMADRAPWIAERFSTAMLVNSVQDTPDMRVALHQR
jgi:hypothetical protein